jgi:hypothetical protein
MEVKHSDPAGGIITKLINRIKEIPDKLQQFKSDLEKSIKAIPKLESQLKPWGKEAELDDIRQKHADVMDALKPKKDGQPTDKPVVRIDAETAKGTKRIEAALLQGLADNAIIVGTERMVPYLPLSLPYMAMIGHDAHLSLPHFDANLALFRNGLELRERVTTALCIETRLPAHPVVTALRDGTVAVFLEQELAAREQFGFPPYKRYIEIASVGKKEAVQRTIASLMRVFSAYAPAPLPYGSGRERGSALILRPAVLDTPLRDLLCTLPPHVIVRVR